MFEVSSGINSSGSRDIRLQVPAGKVLREGPTWCGAPDALSLTSSWRRARHGASISGGGPCKRTPEISRGADWSAPGLNHVAPAVRGETSVAQPTACKKVEVELGICVGFGNSKNHRNAETRECLEFSREGRVGRERGSRSRSASSKIPP